MNPEEQTTQAFYSFDGLTSEQLATLLKTAGVVPCQDRTLQLQQALIVWFHGDIPSMNTFLELCNQRYPAFSEAALKYYLSRK